MVENLMWLDDFQTNTKNGVKWAVFKTLCRPVILVGWEGSLIISAVLVSIIPEGILFIGLDPQMLDGWYPVGQV